MLQKGRCRSWAEMEALEGKSVIQLIKMSLGGHPLPIMYTDKSVHATAAKELQDLIGAAPIFYEYFDKSTHSLRDDVSCNAEIWSCIDLQHARYRTSTGLTPQEIARYVAALSTSSILQDVSLVDASYQKVPKKHLDSLPQNLRARANFFQQRKK